MTKASDIIAHVITLPERADRRMLFGQMAEEQGLAHVFTEGMRSDTPAAGISAAHRAVVAMAKAREFERVLVMEDDALFTAPGAYDHFLRNVPASYDLYLGGIYGGNPDETGALNWFYGLHCYMVHARFYDAFLAVDPHTHIDHALHGLGEYYVCQPYACIQRSGFSDQEGRYKPHAAAVAKEKLFTGQ